MLALSGLHMSIIIGFFDLLMRKVLINRRYRCVILIFLAISYLAITGFSPSASRAVIMLCIVYISYLANNDTDSITSLFIALTLILAFSPYAAYDVALWMSFFATLGILIVSEILSVLKYRLKKKPIHIQILVNITVSIAITLAAIFFTCVFTWLFFGEISLVSPVTNLIFSPLMMLSLILGLLLILLSPVSFLAKFIGQAIILLADIFTESAAAISRLRGITVSLKYEFVPFIIIPLIITLIVFLLIKLKRKWIIAIPPLLSVLAFAVALGIYNSENKAVFDVIYMKNKRSEMLIVTTLDETSICDISTGGYRNLYSACYESSMLEYSTEIESIILTHYHNYHPSSLSKICSDFMVRYVYLPLPEKIEEWEIQAEMVDALKDTGVTVKVYKRGNNIEDSSGNTISVSLCEYSERSTHPLFSVSVSSETKTFTYATSALLESEAPAIENKTDILLCKENRMEKSWRFFLCKIPLQVQFLCHKPFLLHREETDRNRIKESSYPPELPRF
jgi:competence protein ComEC